jgi:PII-like signaling protein
VNLECLKLTCYLGEHDRAHGRLLADELLDLFERHAFRTSVLLRGVEGFGLKHGLHTQRLLSLSEDLPVVSVAVDTGARIEGAVPAVERLMTEGLVTLERARLIAGDIGRVTVPEVEHEATKLTIYFGRNERAEGRPAYRAVVELLRRHGVAGATVFLGVDGTTQGARRRARLFERNAQVPLMVISIGSGEAITHALPELQVLLDRPLLTLERVRICKRDGRRLAEPTHLPAADPSGLPVWQKLMVYAGEQSRHDGQTLHVEMIRRLREAGAAGATCLRGVWGYHGDHEPHGDALLSLRRRVPVVTVVVDTPERIRRWFTIVDGLTDETGLVTSEMVPAFRARAPGRAAGGLEVAQSPC